MPPTHKPTHGRVVQALLLAVSCVLIAFIDQDRTLNAAEIVCIEILDGDKVLMGIATTNVGQSHGELWDMLQSDPLFMEPHVVIPVSDQDPLKAELRGKLRIRLIYRNSQIAAKADVDTLTLVRKSRQSEEWFLSSGDIERTRRLAGIEKPTALSPITDPNRTVRRLAKAVAVLAVATLIAFVVRMRLGRRLRMF